MMIRKSFIKVSFQKEGIHCYPKAPAGVEFLRHPHRHMFHFHVTLEVFHDDRDVEFILFKRELENLFDAGIMLASNKSCEMLAHDLLDYLDVNYSGRMAKVEVYEDGENGGIVYNHQDVA